MEAAEVIESGANAIEKVGQNERTLFIGIMVSVLALV
jgi:hypothetical protein